MIIDPVLLDLVRDLTESERIALGLQFSDWASQLLKNGLIAVGASLFLVPSEKKPPEGQQQTR